MWRIIEPAFVILVGIIVLTQLVLPPIIGKRIFWLFRKSEKEIREQKSRIADLEATETAIGLEKEANKKERKVKKQKNN